jgi:predicted enzyme related to lactoylglutathione lyase
MRNPHGTPIWYEYQAQDADVAQRFYAAVLGWSVASPPDGGMDYRILSAPDGDGVGGLMPTPPGSLLPPGWLIYVGVEDVDATFTQAKAAGARVLMPATDLPGVGRLALLADPDGAPFYVMRGAVDDRSRAFADGPNATAGHAVWNELTASDQEAAMAFYAGLFGWRHDGAMPMGPPGDYRFVHAGATCIGATMPAFPGASPGWLVYFLVDDIDAAVARLRDAGGTLEQGPDEIPGGSFSVAARDPAGARFGFVGERRA